MNTKLVISLTILAGIALAGCQSNPTVTNPEPNTKTTADASIKPSTKPSTPLMNKDESEVKGIEDEFNNIDASKDFPDFTAQDLQQ